MLWLTKWTPDFAGSLIVLHDVLELYKEQRPQEVLFNLETLMHASYGQALYAAQ